MTDELKPTVERYDCGKGNAQFCQGCYQMERDDEYGEWVRFEDYDALRARVERLTVASNVAREVLLHFTPEHIDAVSGTDIGTRLRDALDSCTRQIINAALAASEEEK